MNLSARSCMLLAAACVSIAPCTVWAQSRAADPLPALRQGFLAPPSAARPMVRWWWFGAAVTRPEILRELQQMKADGLGGAELAFVYAEELDDPARDIKNLPFLSAEMLEAVRYAQTEGRRLGLRIDVTLCSGWPYGGPATTLEQAATRLRLIAVPVDPQATEMTTPKLEDGEKLLYSEIVSGTPKSWVPNHGAAPKSGPRVLLLFVQSHTRQQVKRAAVGAEGYVLDPFSREAVKTHLEKVGEPLVKAFGTTPPYAIFSDSLEAYEADWTPALPEEFRKRRGYDLVPRLPELYAGGTPEAEKVRHDYGKTLTELVNENYLVQINEWAHAHRTKFRSQTYGEPAVSLSSQRLVDLPEGEGPQWRAFSTLRWASSGNHVYGNNVTSGESFTWLHSPVFRATPLDMKAEADIDFIMGENQLIYHGWPYSAPKAGIFPGWSLYAAAVFNDHNPWHPVMPAVSDYIARLSYMMRQGRPANQVAILLPTDDAWAGFAPGKVTVSGAMQKLLPREMLEAVLSSGYNYDFVDAEALDRIGVGHAILLVPPTDRIPRETLAKIAAYQKAGGRVILLGRAPSLTPEGEPLGAAVQALERAVRVGDVAGLARALVAAQPPDFRVAEGTDAHTRDVLAFIRRRLNGADVYYVVNTSNRSVRTRAAFATDYMNGERWDAETGRPQAGPHIVRANETMLELAPYESALLVFGSFAQAAQPAVAETKVIADLARDWTVTFTGTGKSEKQSVPKDWATDADTLHYSGEAVYAREFHLSALPQGPIWLQVDGGAAEPGAPDSPPEHGDRDKANLQPDGTPNPLVTKPGPGMRAFYDAPVKEAALVVINGRQAGALWHPPYRLDVAKFLKPGENRIELHLYNTMMNAWSALPPYNYKPLIEKYGDRFQMQDLNKVKALPSGLTGRVQLVQ